MKILMVAIPNHHFFQWVNQLKDAGHDVLWFDITDGGPKSHKIKWVKQIKGWKLKWDYPFRQTIKNSLPKVYKWLQKYNNNNILEVFEALLDQENPDIVHCFEMELAGFPILEAMQKNTLPLIYSSWGSDLFYYKERGITNLQVQVFLKRANYLITDCKRDHEIALKNGFEGEFLGVFPGNGGIAIDISKIKKYNERHVILFKGYQYDVGEAIQIVKAIELLDKDILKRFQFEVYSADKEIKDHMFNSKVLKHTNFIVHPRGQHLQNERLLEVMGNSIIHIANNVSDGMPNTLLESMGMGAFPIQSNPGDATSEVITHGENGFLIDNPFDVKAIARYINQAIIDSELRKQAQDYNVNYIATLYDRNLLKSKIVKLYQSFYIH